MDPQAQGFRFTAMEEERRLKEVNFQGKGPGTGKEGATAAKPGGKEHTLQD